MPFYSFLLVLGTAWALPWTLVGLSIGLIGLVTGGRMRRRGIILECWGGANGWILVRAPLVRGAMAMTLGNVVLGQSPAALDASRDHELVHVRQYLRWGPLFVPAYFLSSLVAWLRGQDPYRDNRFEREAYEAAP